MINNKESTAISKLVMVNGLIHGGCIVVTSKLVCYLFGLRTNNNQQQSSSANMLNHVI